MAQDGICRVASKDDRAHFLRLWGAFLEEGAEQGSRLKANDKNLGLSRQYFDAYTTGQLRGVAAFWSPDAESDPAAVILAGEQFGIVQWDLEDADFATLFGVYIEPEHRGNKHGLRLELFTVAEVIRLGFPGAQTGVRSTNPLGQANQAALSKLYTLNVTEICFTGRFDTKGDSDG